MVAGDDGMRMCNLYSIVFLSCLHSTRQYTIIYAYVCEFSSTGPCVQFAMMEYKSGSSERGRTLMEGVVSSYPKRIDLWSVFIEMENKSGNIEGARRLCQRAVTLRLRARQAKLFFKRWLQLEMASGTEESVDAVKEQARKWVEDNATA